MKLSQIVLIAVALIAAGLAGFLVLRGTGDAPAQPVEVAAAVPKDQVLVAKVNIGVGQRLTPDNLEWQPWPENALRKEFITSSSSPEAINDMKGAVARFELFTGEPIQQAKLVRSGQGYLSAVLDKGKRGISISVSAEAAAGGFIVPNDHVDVILTRSTDQGQTSEPILTNVRVLAINTRLGETGTTGAPDGSGDAAADPKSQVFAGGAIATLELSPDQADTVVNAGQLGKLTLALRSIIDFPQTGPTDDGQVTRNAPIKVIRYGQETNVMSGATAAAGSAAGTPAAPSVDPASFRAPAVSTGATLQ